MGAPTTGVCVVQSVQLFARSLQSATHSDTFPTMSKVPQLDLQFDRDPVFAGLAEFVAHVVVPSSASPRSGVPAAARCHSSFRTRRLPAAAHACAAWNQEIHALGCTPGTETAYRPGEGGLDPGTGGQFPSFGKFAGNPGRQVVGRLNCVAPPLVRSDSVTLPNRTLRTSVVLEGGICHTLSS